MKQREVFICTGDLIPNDNNLGMPETTLRSRTDAEVITAEIRCSKVFIKIEGEVDYSQDDPRIVRDLVVREAQYNAQIWLSVIGFVEGASYSTRISTIEDSTGCIRELGPKPTFGSDQESLGIENAIESAGIVAKLSIENEHFRIALYDYVTALNFTQDSPFFLYRALEALFQHYGDWDKMNKSLGTSESETGQLIKPYADKIRHGKSLNENQLKDTYLNHYCASKYVRDALRAFIRTNHES